LTICGKIYLMKLMRMRKKINEKISPYSVGRLFFMVGYNFPVVMDSLRHHRIDSLFKQRLIDKDV
jgi:hypothetical protein